METYYLIRIPELSKKELEGLLIELHQEFIAARNVKGANCTERLIGLFLTASEHPNVEDVYMHDAEHSGFFPGEKVLVEATVEEACISKRLNSQHLPVLINDHSKGAVAVTPHVNTVYHMEENA